MATTSGSAVASAGDRRRLEQGAGLGQVGGAGGVGEEAVVADAVEAGGQDVDQEAADELAGGEGHQLAPGLALGAVVLPAEGDAALVEGDQAAVGDGDAVGVAGEVGQDRLGAGEGALGVDHPLGAAQRGQVSGEGGTVGEAGECRRRRPGGPRHGRRRASPGTGAGRGARARARAGRSRGGRRSSSGRRARGRRRGRCSARADGG